MKRLYKIFILSLLFALGLTTQAQAQHVLSLTGGYGFGSIRLYPAYESQTLLNCYSSGVGWRYYSDYRYWGGFGVDLDVAQRGFSFAPYGYGSYVESDLEYYTRDITSIMIPIVWQPHIYTPNHRMRIFIEAAASFSCDIYSTYDNQIAKDWGNKDWEGVYNYKLARDNRFGFGLAFGAGFSVLLKNGWELLLRGRYYFGYSDVVRNYNSYSNNRNDGSENPFWSTPLRSQLDSFSLNIGISFRLGNSEEGFRVWQLEKREKPLNMGSGFGYDGI